MCSKETWPPELPSDREDSEALGAGGTRAGVLSAESLGRWPRDRRSALSSSRLPWVFLNPSGFRFFSIDLRRLLGRSNVDGSKERRRRVNCCRRPRLLGAERSWSWSGSMTVGAVVMMAGAAAGYVSSAPGVARGDTYAGGWRAPQGRAGRRRGQRAPLP